MKETKKIIVIKYFLNLLILVSKPYCFFYYFSFEVDHDLDYIGSKKNSYGRLGMLDEFRIACDHCKVF